MPETVPFLESPSGTREEIMKATYHALCEHGYAGLTIDRIGETFSKSKSLVYHHYDGKDDLLLDFLGFMIEQFEGTMPFEKADAADQHIEAVLDHVLAVPLTANRAEFARAIVELRAQAAHDDRYREHFTRHDQFFVERLESIVESGIESGVFVDVDPHDVASFLVTTIIGSMTQRVTSKEDTAAVTRTELDAYLRARLLAEAE